jgi:uncharacterized protein
MPDGKPAGVRCLHLTDENLCRIHGTPEYPPVCAALTPTDEICGSNRDEALRRLSLLEELTKP